MVALQIRDVPDDVRDELARRAEAAGQSLQAFLLTLVTAEAQRSRNATLPRTFEGRSDGARLSADDVLAELDAGRRSRDVP
ncbi:FitA-like ribbon-helix-helix domain-containing protein [Quadrisphaera granulorum]|nr:hypothetical protein [Quadrisphaera granulorum]